MEKYAVATAALAAKNYTKSNPCTLNQLKQYLKKEHKVSQQKLKTLISENDILSCFNSFQNWG